MDDYKSNFDQKMQYIIQMVSAFGSFRVPLDWFNVSVVLQEGDVKSKQQVHGFGTTYRLQNLLDMYQESFKEYLRTYKICIRQTKLGYVFTNVATLAQI